MPGREGFDKRSGFVKRSPDMLQRFIDPAAVAAEIERVCSLSRQVTTAETELGRAVPRRAINLHGGATAQYRGGQEGRGAALRAPGPQEGVSLVARSPRVVALAHRRAPPRQPFIPTA
jgi:hypothetical protein